MYKILLYGDSVMEDKNIRKFINEIDEFLKELDSEKSLIGQEVEFNVYVNGKLQPQRGKVIRQKFGGEYVIRMPNGQTVERNKEEIYTDFVKESEASDIAKEKGLVSRGFGRYSKKAEGPITHETSGGKLVPFRGSGTETPKRKGEFTSKTEKEKEEEKRHRDVMKKKKGLTDVKKSKGEKYEYTFRWNGKAGSMIFTKTDIARMRDKGLPPSRIILDRITKKIEKEKQIKKGEEEKRQERSKQGIEARKLLKKITPQEKENEKRKK